MQRCVINDPHHWVYWSFKFSQLWPRADILDLPLRRHLEAYPEITDAAERSHHLQVDNTQPTEDLFAYRRSEYCDSLVIRSQRRLQQIESIRETIAHFQSSTESRVSAATCSSTQRLAPSGSRPPTPPLPCLSSPHSLLSTMSYNSNNQYQSHSSRWSRDQGRGSGNDLNSFGRGACTRGGSQKPSYHVQQFDARTAEVENSKAVQEAQAAQIKELQEQLKAAKEMMQTWSGGAHHWDGSWWGTSSCLVVIMVEF